MDEEGAEAEAGGGGGARLAILVSNDRFSVSNRFRMMAEVALCFRHLRFDG